MNLSQSFITSCVSYLNVKNLLSQVEDLPAMYHLLKGEVRGRPRLQPRGLTVLVGEDAVMAAVQAAWGGVDVDHMVRHHHPEFLLQM